MLYIPTSYYYFVFLFCFFLFLFFVVFVFNKLVFTSLSRRAYTASLGETAVAFDFGPLAAVPKTLFGQKGKDEVVAYPLYILYENGETFLTYISLLHRWVVAVTHLKWKLSLGSSRDRWGWTREPCFWVCGNVAAFRCLACIFLRKG